MTTRYAFLEYAPDPFGPIRWPVAAVVQAAGGAITVAESSRLPGVPCLSVQDVRHLRHLMDRLYQIETMAELPASLGLHLDLGEPRTVHMGFEETVTWLRSHVLPSRAPSGVRHGGGARRKQRRTEGYSFFKTHGIAKHVARGFTPDRDLGGMLAGTGLPEISHWAGVPGSALLMEPVSALRPHFEDELIQTRLLFGSYSDELRKTEASSDVSLVVYLLPGGAEGARALVYERFGTVGEIVDTAVHEHRERFFDRIREAALLAERQTDLIH